MTDIRFSEEYEGIKTSYSESNIQVLQVRKETFTTTNSLGIKSSIQGFGKYLQINNS